MNTANFNVLIDKIVEACENSPELCAYLLKTFGKSKEEGEEDIPTMILNLLKSKDLPKPIKSFIEKAGSISDEVQDKLPGVDIGQAFAITMTTIYVASRLSAGAAVGKVLGEVLINTLGFESAEAFIKFVLKNAAEKDGKTTLDEAEYQVS
jgi:hypothetical protein